ncbi:hypothetical protein BCEN4_2480003 [Burkholderia cenocepacia]|nr:hypothetical protein BCEN4_2480003 [Burkholderia cenocepacia]
MRTLSVAIIVAAHYLRNPADTSARHFPPFTPVDRIGRPSRYAAARPPAAMTTKAGCST